MSKKHSVITVILMVSLCAFGGTNVTLTLVKNKKPIAVIAIPDNASKVIVASAEAVNKYIKLITGITLPVRRESELAKDAHSVLSLGPTDLAASIGLTSAKMQVGEFVCQRDGNVIFIFGRDDNRFNPNYGSGENGTWNGTCRFVEQYLNVRWLWPGKYGLAFSKRDTLSISMKSPFTEKPVIMSRRCRTPIYQSYWATDWKEVGIDNDEYKRLSKSLYDWQKFHLMGGSVEVSPGGHGFTKWWENYSKKHPEWFAEQTDGTRNQNFDKWGLTKYTVKLCISNTNVASQVVANAVEHYKDNSTSVFMAAINDGGNAGFCLCEKCLAWDKPEKASPYQLMYESGPFDYCSLSDRYVKFWNRIGKEFSRKCPGKLISVSGYGAVTAPPVANKIEYESILMSYVGFDYLNDGILEDDRTWWRGWQARTVGKMALRSNMLCEGYGLNYVYISQMGKDFNKLFSGGQVYAVDNDSLFNYWGSNGINYYMLYKLMWDPSLNVEKELDDYCRIGFGKAAPLVKQYFKEIEKITSEIAAHNWNWKLGILNGLPTIYTPKRIDELRLILEEAIKVADGDNAKRIEFLMEGLEYTKVLSAILKVKSEGNKEDDYMQALDARKEFFKKQKFPFSASYPADKFWRSCIGNDLRK